MNKFHWWKAKTRLSPDEKAAMRARIEQEAAELARECRLRALERAGRRSQAFTVESPCHGRVEIQDAGQAFLCRKW